MKSLIVLLAVVACVVAEPPLLKYSYPLSRIHDYYYSYSPAVLPVVRDVVSGLVPTTVTPYKVPYYAGLKVQYHDQDLLGQARYGHIEPGQSHHAIQDAFGNKIGAFSYYNAEGKLKYTSYIADAAGYRVSSNDLPIDTPEVASAKLAHLAEHAAALRIKRDAPTFSTFQTSTSDLRYTQPFPHAYPTTHLQPTVTKDGFLEETPEVLAAKSDHFAKVADSRARIAALERSSVNSFSRPVESFQNTFTPVSHQTINPVPTQSFDYRYTQPQTFTSSAPVETPEALAAKAKYFAELAATRARGATLVEPVQQVQNPVVTVANTPVQPTTSFQSLDYRYTQPVPHAYPTTNLQPKVTRDGFLEETPEVLAAKANHFAQHAAAQSRILNYD